MQKLPPAGIRAQSRERSRHAANEKTPSCQSLVRRERLARHSLWLKENGDPTRPPFEVLSAAKRQLLPRRQEEDDPS